MDSLYTLILNNSTLEYALSGYSPLTLTICPSALFPDLKVSNLQYSFLPSDHIETHTLYYHNTALPIDQSNMFLEEVGDPRNFNVSYTFLLSSKNSQIFDIQIMANFVGVSSECINIRMEVLPSSVLSLSAVGLFEDIHLINHKMFGKDNTILYNFESFNPSYLLPVVVKW